MKRSLRLTSLFLILVMSLSLTLTSCWFLPNLELPWDTTTEIIGCETTPDPTDTTTDPATTTGDPNPDWNPEDEYQLPLEDGYNQLTLYWKYNGSYQDCDIWIWWGDVAGKGYTFHECAYGAKVVVNVPEGIEEVGFIVRKSCSEPGGSSWGNATKDFDQDRFAVLDGRETVIYLKPGDGSQYTSNDGGKTLNMIKKFSMAGMVDEHKIQFRVTPDVLISSFDDVKVFEGDRELTVTAVSTIGRKAANGYITVEESLDLSKNYRVELADFGEKPVVPTDILTRIISLRTTTTTAPTSVL